MATSFGKKINIMNRRVEALHYALLVCMLGVLILAFRFDTPWIESFSMAGHVIVDMWVEQSPIAEMRSNFNQWLSEPLCNTPGDYEYWYGTPPTWKYENYTCLADCSIQPGPSCVNHRSTYRREEKDQVLIVTEFQRSSVDAESKELITTGAGIVPSAEDIVIAFTYRFDMPQTDALHGLSVLGDQEQTNIGSSQTNILTVILSKDGTPWREIFPEAGPLRFTVKELFAMAGAETWLHDIHPDLGANSKPNATYPAGPVGWITGALLELRLTCYNSPQKTVETGGHSGPTCYLRPHLAPMWSTVEESSTVDDVYLLAHGVRVKAVTYGEWKAFSFHKLVTSVVSLVVLFKLPKRALRYIVSYCFGHMSQLYRSALVDDFDMGKIVGGIASRLMVNSCAFSELAGQNGGDISYDSMQASLLNAFRDHIDPKEGTPVLDENELLGFLRFANKAIRDQEITRRHDQFGRVLRRMFARCATAGDHSQQDTSRDTSRRDTGPVDAAMFMEAAASSDVVSFDALVHFFDADRKRGCLERIFMPGYIRAIHDAACERRADPTEDQPRICSTQTRGSISKLAQQLQCLKEGRLEFSPEADHQHLSRLHTVDPDVVEALERELPVMRLEIAELHEHLTKLVHAQQSEHAIVAIQQSELGVAATQQSKHVAAAKHQSGPAAAVKHRSERVAEATQQSEHAVPAMTSCMGPQPVRDTGGTGRLRLQSGGAPPMGAADSSQHSEHPFLLPGSCVPDAESEASGTGEAIQQFVQDRLLHRPH